VCAELIGVAGWISFFAVFLLCGLFVERLHSLLLVKPKVRTGKSWD
jgi:hypothetical protein